MKRRVLIAGLVLGCAAFAFAGGLWIGIYQPPIYHRLRALKRSVAGTDETPKSSGQRMMESAFTDPLIAGQLNPAVSSIAEAAARLRDYDVDVALFPNAYRDLTVTAANHNGDRLAINYALGGRTYVGHAYASAASPPRQCAVVIVPGSGPNQSSEIFAGRPENYHGAIVPAIRDVCDPYVFVKPNEDFVAIHNGVRKLNYTAIVASLLNRGSSYSAHYIINALALVKHLQGSYRYVVPMGLSQGGDAALNVALQSRPAGAVIASGFSIYDEQMTWANLEQVIIPGAYRNFNARVRAEVAGSPTRFFFTSGADELVTWGLEAETRATCTFLANLPNVTCTIHPGIHEFPLTEVRSFLQTLITPR